MILCGSKTFDPAEDFQLYFAESNRHIWFLHISDAMFGRNGAAKFHHFSEQFPDGHGSFSSQASADRSPRRIFT